MTNEEILIRFLKSKRKFSYVKRNFLMGFSPTSLNIVKVNENKVPVIHVISYLLLWEATDKGWSYWNNLYSDWGALCRHFKLEGTIDLNSIFKKD